MNKLYLSDSNRFDLFIITIVLVVTRNHIIYITRIILHVIILIARCALSIAVGPR